MGLMINKIRISLDELVNICKKYAISDGFGYIGDLEDKFPEGLSKPQELEFFIVITNQWKLK